jgi:hypothetical protein
MPYEPTAEEKGLMRKRVVEEQAKFDAEAEHSGEPAPQYLFVDADPWAEDGKADELPPGRGDGETP